jgi:hypothetical protein
MLFHVIINLVVLHNPQQCIGEINIQKSFYNSESTKQTRTKLVVY